MSKTIYSVYKATNKISNMQYIGMTNNMKRRLYGHKNSKKTTHFSRSIQKYGFDNFEFEIILQTLDYEHCKEYEIKLISIYNTYRPNGYNLTLGGEGTVGYTHSKDTKLKLSKLALNRVPSDQARENMRNAKLGTKNSFHGKSHTQETKDKISNTKRGRKLTEEHKRNVGLAGIKYQMPPRNQLLDMLSTFHARQVAFYYGTTLGTVGSWKRKYKIFTRGTGPYSRSKK